MKLSFIGSLLLFVSTAVICAVLLFTTNDEQSANIAIWLALISGATMLIAANALDSRPPVAAIVRNNQWVRGRTNLWLAGALSAFLSGSLFALASLLWFYPMLAPARLTHYDVFNGWVCLLAMVVAYAVAAWLLRLTLRFRRDWQRQHDQAVGKKI